MHRLCVGRIHASCHQVWVDYSHRKAPRQPLTSGTANIARMEHAKGMSLLVEHATIIKLTFSWHTKHLLEERLNHQGTSLVREPYGDY